MVGGDKEAAGDGGMMTHRDDTVSEATPPNTRHCQVERGDFADTVMRDTSPQEIHAPRLAGSIEGVVRSTTK